jgi:hypothetical protein
MEWKALARSEALPKYRSSREELKARFFTNTGLPTWARDLLSQSQNWIIIRQGDEEKTVTLSHLGITYKNAKGSSIQAAIATTNDGHKVIVVKNDDDDEDINAQPLTGDAAASHDSPFDALFKTLFPAVYFPAVYYPPTAWRFERAYSAIDAQPVRPTVDMYSW